MNRIPQKGGRGSAVFLFVCLLLMITFLGAKVIDAVGGKSKYPQGAQVLIPLGVCAMTAYTNRPQETDSTPNWTSISDRVRVGGIAASQDWIKSGKVRYGDIIFVPELGRFFTVNDCMNERLKKRFDVFTFDLEEARRFGLKHVQVYLVKET